MARVFSHSWRFAATWACLATWALGGALAGGAEPETLFHDEFAKGPHTTWTWKRDKKDHWRVRDGAFEIRLPQGRELALARDLPKLSGGVFAIEVTFESLAEPTQQYEQIGLFWEHNGKEVFKYVKERIDGKVYVFPGKKEVAGAVVQLRLVVDGPKLTAQYRSGAEGAFQTAFERAIPDPANGQHAISIQCFHGPADAEHWVRVRDFRVLKSPAP